MNPKSKFEVMYSLDGGVTGSFTAPMLLAIGEQFEHEFGTYEVKDIEYNQATVTLKAHCSKVSSDRNLFKEHLPKL